MKEGEVVGTKEGVADGIFDGDVVGFTVGLLDEMKEGEAVGKKEGAADGILVGFIDSIDGSPGEEKNPRVNKRTSDHTKLN